MEYSGQGNKPQKNAWGIASPNAIDFFDPNFDIEGGNPMMGGGGGGGLSFGMGGGYRQGFNPADFPTELDGSKLSYGLPSIWQGDMNTAETNAWANSMKTNEDIPQFMQNTFTDGIAERTGLGVYNMDFNNPDNRPAEQLTPQYAADVKKASVWRAARKQAQAANAMGGSGSTRGRGSRGNRSRPSKPSPGFGYSRRPGGR